MMLKTNFEKTKARVYLKMALFGLFVVLASTHICSQRPLWGDELLVLKNLQKYQGTELFRVLDETQAFPRVYLMGIQFLGQGFVYHVVSLRLFPFLAMMLAVLIWGNIFDRVLSPMVALMSFAAFAVSYRMVYYAAELKPYSMDVLSVGFFVLFLIYQEKWIAQKRWRMLFAGTVLLPWTLLVSYGALFVCWMPVWNWILYCRQEKSARWGFVLGILSLLFAGYVAYETDLRFSAQMPAMLDYWQDYFVCTKTPICFGGSFSEAIRRLTAFWYGNSKIFVRAASAMIPFFFFGLFYFGIQDFRRSRWIFSGTGSIALMVFVELFVLGLMHRYPFTGERVTLFFAPFVFCLIARSLFGMRHWLLIGPLMNGYYLLFLLWCGMNTFWTFCC